MNTRTKLFAGAVRVGLIAALVALLIWTLHKGHEAGCADASWRTSHADVCKN